MSKYLDTLKNIKSGFEKDEWLKDDVEALDYAIKVIESQKTGHWIEHEIKTIQWVECSECHITYKFKTRYCSNCGAKMEGENNEQI